MRRASIHGFVALSLIVVAACSGAGGSRTPGSSAALSAPASAFPSASGSPAASSMATASEFDSQFIDMMVPHHQSAVEMARLALDSAEHPDLKAMAQDIISAQEEEIGQLQDWRVSWFGSADTPGMDAMPLLPGMDSGDMPGHEMGSATMDMTQEIEALRTADRFDLAFIDSMTAHHQMAIDAASMALEMSEQPEIRTMADDIIAAQQREIDQLAAWRSEWYADAE